MDVEHGGKDALAGRLVRITIRRDDADLGNDEPQWNSRFKAGTCVAAQLVVDELALVRQRGCSRMLL